MSRIGKKPIPVPQGVEVRISGGQVSVKGKNGELSLRPHPQMSVAFDEGQREIVVTRPDDERDSRALHGLTRSLLSNMVQGVTTHFEKKLEIQGVGYRAQLAGFRFVRDQDAQFTSGVVVRVHHRFAATQHEKVGPRQVQRTAQGSLPANTVCQHPVREASRFTDRQTGEILICLATRHSHQIFPKLLLAIGPRHVLGGPRVHVADVAGVTAIAATESLRSAFE